LDELRKEVWELFTQPPVADRPKECHPAPLLAAFETNLIVNRINKRRIDFGLYLRIIEARFMNVA
jgi:hypothetical protein